MKEKIEEQDIPMGSKKKRRWLLYLILILLFLLIGIPLLLQLHPVQNWLIDKVATNTEKKTSSKVTIDNVTFSLTKGFTLNEFYVSTPEIEDDTLMYVGAFSTSLSKNILSVFKNEILMDEINLSEAKINVHTTKGDTISNLKKFLLGLANEKKQKNKEGEALIIELEQINLADVAISIDDENTEDITQISLGKANVYINSISLMNNDVDIENLILVDPFVAIEKGEDKQVIVDSEFGIEGIEHTEYELPILLNVNTLSVDNGRFKLNDWNHQVLNKVNALDYHHLDAENINVEANNILIEPPFNIEAVIESFAVKESSGFEIKDLEVDHFQIDTNHVLLSDFKLDLKRSVVQNYIEFKYNDLSDFSDFGKKVSVVSDMKSSTIAISDLLYFFPELKEKGFFKQNPNSILKLSGIVNGNLYNLEADKLNLAIDNRVKFKGAVSMANLHLPKSALFNLYVDNLNTSIKDLRRIIPGFNPPEQFNKLGPINFTGDIEGFFNDLVIYGNTHTDIGTVDLDMRLDTKLGIQEAKYSGEISLNQFDLYKWTDNPNFGLTTLSGRVLDGKGLSINNVDSDIEANLESFMFKGYNYNSIGLEGELTQNKFVGSVLAQDPNLDFSFDGEVSRVDDVFKSDFKADIEKIDLMALNLSPDIRDITGKIDLKLSGTSISDFEGTAGLTEMELVYKDKTFEFDSLSLLSSPQDQLNRTVILYSDILNVSLDGRFDLAKVVPAFKNLIYDEHPLWAKKLGINQRIANLTNEQKFRFKLSIKDTKNYLELANIKDLRFKYFSLEGTAGLQDKKFETEISIDTSFYKNFVFKKLQLSTQNNKRNASLDVGVENIVSGSKVYEPIVLKTTMEGDVIDLSIKTANVLDSVGVIDMGLSIVPDGNNIAFSVRNNELNILNSNWLVSGDNKILIGDNFIGIDNLEFTDGYRSINLTDVHNHGIQGELRKFDFVTINGIIDYDKIDFKGEGNVDLRVDSIFTNPIINGLVDIPEFTLNDEDYGQLKIKATDKNEGFINTLVQLNNPVNDFGLYVEADYDKDQGYLNGVINIDDLPLDIFEFIIEDGISLTSGTADIDATLLGLVDNLTLDGDAQLKGAATRVNYLGNYVTIGDQPIKLTNDLIDFTNVTMTDRLGNVGLIDGGMTHNLFKDFGVDLSISSDNFLALDTGKEDNPLYYGTGMGEVEVSFLGPLHSADIEVNAIMGEGSILNIPIEDSYEDFDESFIKFVDRDAVVNDSLTEADFITLEGVNVEMNLTITEAAQVNIIFDEKTNDVIRGTGVGDMRIVVTREGEFNVFGDYEVFQGEYLFTAWGVVAKPFNVRKGGIITWTGDPINANINLEADYEDLRVPTNIFLQEYLVTGNNDLLLQSRKRTKVDLTLDLTGTLYNPIVNFDIKFPELQGELRSFADAKLRTLKENYADLNEQVAGLIIFRSFLPSNRAGNVITTGNAVVETGYNTLSEFVSNQLSYLLSSILQEALTDNGFVSGIDFEIGISRNAGLLNNVANNNYFPDEIEVHFKPRFQNDKWGIDYGTSFVNAKNSSFGITNYVIHDVALEYFLTEDKRLKLRAYGKWDKDEVQFQNEQKYGMGLNYRKEFGSLIDFKDDIEFQLNKLKDDPAN